MQYNTQQKRMPLPEYGRSIQNMVDHALTIEDRSERQRCANTIINIMGNMFPHLRDIPDFKHKLWDHLAIMADFKLDIDYPYEVIRKDNLITKPETVPYPSTKIRYRHYGRTLEVLIKKAIDFPEGDEKQNLVALICNHMKKDYMSWNKDTVDDRKIADDLAELSGGKLKYKTLVIIIVIFSWVISNAGVSTIIQFSAPLLNLIYPGLLVLIILAFFHKKIKNNNVYRLAAYFGMITSALEILAGFGLPTGFVSALPLSDMGFAWIIPAIVGAIIGKFIPSKS